jgi:nitroimidazol reductase NimA-like FMN-containing flavoprotein (pyridoxamine 5'-phosphate oxidase superfamily)
LEFDFISSFNIIPSLFSSIFQFYNCGFQKSFLPHNNLDFQLNFVMANDQIYFHGAKKGKKIDLIKEKSNASFNVLEIYSLLPSYFSTDDRKACPATHLYKSIVIEGNIEFVENYNEKANALEFLMKKLQKEDKYIPLHDEIYKKAINATCVYKLVSNKISAKFGLGQNSNEERFNRVCEHLKLRASKQDLRTLKLLIHFRN